MSQYAYIRIAPNSEKNVHEIEERKQNALSMEKIIGRETIVERQHLADIAQPPKELGRYINTIFRSGDTLFTRGLHDLGSNTQQITDVIRRCQARGVSIVFLNDPTRNKPDLNKLLWKLIEQFGNIEEDYKKLKLEGRRKVALRHGKQLGRPSKSMYQFNIYHLRSYGYKQKEVADRLNISLSTVKRYWRKYLLE